MAVNRADISYMSLRYVSGSQRQITLVGLVSALLTASATASDDHDVDGNDDDLPHTYFL